MKKLLLAFMAVTMFACSSDDSTPADPGNGNPNPVPTVCTNVFTGKVWLSTQAEVDAFASHGYCKIKGGLTIGTRVEVSGQGEDIEYTDIISDITSLAGLSTLKTIEGGLIIEQNDLLTSLEGLNNLEETKFSIWIEDNQLITSLNGLNGLKKVGTASQTESVLNIIYNNSLTSLEGLNSLKQLSRISIDRNGALINLKGLENLETVDWGFSISSNEHLVSLEGIQNLKSLDYMIIMQNPSLTNFCPIRNLVTSEQIFDSLQISGNLYNPTVQDIVAGNCSQ